jgi:hypothetical protein
MRDKILRALIEIQKLIGEFGRQSGRGGLRIAARKKKAETEGGGQDFGICDSDLFHHFAAW